MRSRLFWKVYLTLLASLVAVAVATGLFWRITSDREANGWTSRRDDFLAAMLPANDAQTQAQATVDRLAAAFDADISVYDKGGALIASAGEVLPLPDAEGRGRRGGHRFAATLADGRTVVVRAELPFGPPGGGNFGYLILIAAVIGLAAYPIVRHLTRRLEALRRGVEKFGQGDLLARVPTHGRDEVAAVATSFNSAADRIEKLVGAHRSLLANASHELRSPLARLRLAAELNARNPSEARRQEMLESLDELDELVEEILLASRLDHLGVAPQKPARLPVDLLAVAAEEASRHGLEAGGTPATIQGDAKLLTRLVRNLIVNALRHGAPPVEITVEAVGGKSRLTVRDHGPGIPASEAERVFEPFYRPAGRSETAGGWGLGLALVRQIARHHGATVRLEAPEGGGARFTVDFGASQPL